MFCSKCGAAVTGNFCCVCGERIRSALEDFRREERRQRAIFKASIGVDIGSVKVHIAQSCWLAAANKCELERGVIGGGKIAADAYDRLQKTAALARRLYTVLMKELEEV